MIPADFGMEAALNSGTPAPAAAGTGARASLRAGGGPAREAASGPGSFKDELQAACRSDHPASTPCAAAAGKARGREKTVDPQHAKTELASAGGKKPVDAAAVAEIASLLLQLLQGAVAAGKAPAAGSEPPAAGEEGAAGEDSPSETLARVIELLQQMASSPDGASPQADPDMAQLLEQLDSLSGAVPPAALSGKAHQLLKNLHAHLSGAAWGKMVRDMAADGAPAAVKPEENGLSAGADDLVAEALDSSPNRREATAAAPLRALAAPAGSESKSGAGFSPEASAAAAQPGRETAAPPAASPTRTGLPHARSTHDGRSAGADPEAPRPSMPAVETSGPPAKETETTPASLQTAAGVSHVRDSGEGRRGGRAAEAPRPPTPAADTPAPAIGAGEDQSADRSEGRASSGERPLGKDLLGAEAGPEKGASAAEAFEAPAVDPRSSRLHEASLEKASGAAAAGREKEPAAGAVRTGMFEQIVQRAVVQVRNDQSEIKIHLKPDFLGNVRMQILTENHQVSVRILTELPAVRDMIEAGIQQLKSELQSQGLQVDRLEVSVSDDLRRHSEHKARQGAKLWGEAAEGASGADRRSADERLEPIYYRPRPHPAGRIDMFA
jgi:hypothetical protein